MKLDRTVIKKRILTYLKSIKRREPEAEPRIRSWEDFFYGMEIGVMASFIAIFWLVPTAVFLASLLIVCGGLFGGAGLYLRWRRHLMAIQAIRNLREHFEEILMYKNLLCKSEALFLGELIRVSDKHIVESLQLALNQYYVYREYYTRRGL